MLIKSLEVDEDGQVYCPGFQGARIFKFFKKKLVKPYTVVKNVTQHGYLWTIFSTKQKNRTI